MNQKQKIGAENIILKTSVITEILPVFFYVILNRRINDKSLRVVFFLLLITLLTDVYALYTIANNRNNVFSFNINVLAETLFLFAFFYLNLGNKSVKRILFFISCFFLVFWLLRFIKEGQHTFLYSCAILENTSVLFLALYYYFEKIAIVNFAYIYIDKKFWIVTAYFVYIAGTFFLLLYIPTVKFEEQLKYYVLNYIFVIVRTILLSIAMFMKNNNAQGQKFKLTSSRLL